MAIAALKNPSDREIVDKVNALIDAANNSGGSASGGIISKHGTPEDPADCNQFLDVGFYKLSGVITNTPASFEEFQKESLEMFLETFLAVTIPFEDMDLGISGTMTAIFQNIYRREYERHIEIFKLSEPLSQELEEYLGEMIGEHIKIDELTYLSLLDGWRLV